MRLRALRRAAVVLAPVLVAAAGCAVIAAGAVRPIGLAGGAPAATDLLALTAVGAILVAAILRRLHYQPPSARAQRVSWWLAAAPRLVDVELALAITAGVYAVLAATGGVTSPVHPLVYGVVAFGLTLLSAPGAAVTMLAPVAIEATWVARADDPRALAVPVALHAVFLVAAAAAHALFLRGLVASHRRRRALRLERELRSMTEQARDYRLISSALGPASRAPRSRQDEERLLAAGGVALVGDACAWVLETVKRSLGARTVALAWLDGDGDRLKLKDIVSDRDQLVPPRLPVAGVLGAVVRDRAPVVLAAAKAGQLPYYDDPGIGAGAAVVAVPVLEGPHLRGVLCADRPTPFADDARELLVDAAAQLVRAVQAEQVFRAVERAKYEHERFFQATALLGRALTPEQVMETAFDAAAAIVDCDAAAITLYDRERSRHRVAAVRVKPGAEPLLDAAALAGLEFKRQRRPGRDGGQEPPLPAGRRRAARGHGAHLHQAHQARRGALAPGPAPGRRRRGHRHADAGGAGRAPLRRRRARDAGRDRHPGRGLAAERAALQAHGDDGHHRWPDRADPNHRTFQDRFAQLLDRAERHGHQAALLLTDVDFFKKVNDNYGHPVGDEVLRRVARVLEQVARKIDITARYGGEEFVVVLESSNAEQARQVGDRLRQEVGKLVIETEKGPLRVTMSVGVASFPDDARDRATLIERADHALYHAKHSGRNQVVTYQQFVAARAKKAS
ncbi:MAG: GGDEF domain-containing protein [Kofleriaceae bacterium]|nr:GGDEF domain-containing protein [Kofleriaceae bacterium]